MISFPSLTTRWHNCIINSANWISRMELLWRRFSTRSHCRATFGDHNILKECNSSLPPPAPPSPPPTEVMGNTSAVMTCVSHRQLSAHSLPRHKNTESLWDLETQMRQRDEKYQQPIPIFCGDFLYGRARHSQESVLACKRKPQRHLLMLCDIIWLVKWLDLYTYCQRVFEPHRGH